MFEPLPLSKGNLELERIDTLLKLLPLDISYVDENDVVRYYSDRTDKLFDREPADLGRTLQDCHSEKSQAQLVEIMNALRSGEADLVEIYKSKKGKVAHIRYWAVRDEDGTYRGVVETAQEVPNLDHVRVETYHYVKLNE